MSSFPQHQQNIEALHSLGFDVSDCLEDGKVTMDSWGYEELVYLMSDIIQDLKKNNFSIKR